MKIKMIAADSMGTRSMATYVETIDMKILIDPGVSLAPNRFGLEPHPLEIKRMEEHWREIKEYMKKSQYSVISHYHYDHHNPEEPEIYAEKKVFVKDPINNINKSQAERAKYFLPLIDKIADVHVAEGNKIEVGNTTIEFSEAVPHGPSSRLGYVFETVIDDGKEVFIHTSDVEGPALEEQVKPILEEKPTTVYLDGPLSYIMYRYGKKNMELSIKNMKRIIDHGAKNLVYDHHFLRDPKYKEKIRDVEEYGKERGTRVITAAEYMNKELEPLEFMRKELHRKYPIESTH